MDRPDTGARFPLVNHVMAAPATVLDAKRSRRALPSAAGAALLFLASALLLQWLAGAYRAELAGHPDEPAHYITGLMVHDYLKTWPPVSPLRFAETFYIHYPKVALGHWPPFFYLIQAAWTIPFSTSRISLLLLMALLATLLAWSVYRAAAREYGAWAGVACGVLLLLLPTVQEFTSMVMTEIPVALLCFWAAVCFGRYMEQERWRDAAGFGILASLAILTKGSGLALALLPPLAMAFGRRFDLLRRKATWIPALLVAAICGPWYAWTFGMQSNGWAETVDQNFLLKAFPYNTWQLVRLAGPALFILAAAGFVAKAVRPAKVEPKWASMAALVASVWVFQSLVPASLDIRHLTTVAGPLLLFAAAGVEWLAPRLHVRASVLAGAAVLLFAAATFAIPMKTDRGYAPVVEDILSRHQGQHSAILVSSQYDGEGVVIAGVAMREERPWHVVLRASKVLAQAQWNGANYRVLYPDEDAVEKYLESVPVAILVMDGAPGRKDHPHHRQLERMLVKYADRWETIGVYPKPGGPAMLGTGARVYRLRNRGDRGPGKIRIDLAPMLGRTIEN